MAKTLDMQSSFFRPGPKHPIIKIYLGRASNQLVQIIFLFKQVIFRFYVNFLARLKDERKRCSKDISPKLMNLQRKKRSEQVIFFLAQVYFTPEPLYLRFSLK